MDLVHLFETLATIAAGSAGAWAATEGAKRWKAISWLNEGQKMRLRAFAGVLSAVVVVLGGVGNDTMKPDDLQGVFVSLFSFGAIWVGSHTIHKVVAPGKPVEPS